MTAFRVPRAHRRVGGPLRVPEDDRAFATRLARYCARNPVALERLTYDHAAEAVTYRSDKSKGPTAGTETADPLEFLARVLAHIPDKGHVTTRYYGWYANRPRGRRDEAAPAAADGPPAIVPAPPLAPTEASRRWTKAVRRASTRRSSGASTVHAVTATETRSRWRSTFAAAPPRRTPALLGRPTLALCGGSGGLRRTAYRDNAVERAHSGGAVRKVGSTMPQ